MQIKKIKYKKGVRPKISHFLSKRAHTGKRRRGEEKKKRKMRRKPRKVWIFVH